MLFLDAFEDAISTSRRRAINGLTIFITGLPASGKSTLAAALARRFTSLGAARITVLDGDAVRQQFTPALGYSKADRERHVGRVADLAAEVTAAGGIAICSLIAPYQSGRDEARARIAAVGRFVLVYLSTPLHACEARDPKGLYAKARAGTVTGFTGVSDPYEPPPQPDLMINTDGATPDASADAVIAFLRSAGWQFPRASV